MELREERFMKSLMKLGEGHEWGGVTGKGLWTWEMGTGMGRGLSSSPQQPSPNHPTDRGGK